MIPAWSRFWRTMPVKRVGAPSGWSFNLWWLAMLRRTSSVPPMNVSAPTVASAILAIRARRQAAACRDASTAASIGLPGLTRGEVSVKNPPGTMDTVAVTAQTRLDSQRIRADFAYLEELRNGKPVAFLDSAASAQ